MYMLLRTCYLYDEVFPTECKQILSGKYFAISGFLRGRHVECELKGFLLREYLRLPKNCLPSGFFWIDMLVEIPKSRML